VIGAAVKVGRIAVGDIEERRPKTDGKDRERQTLGSTGWRALMRKLSPSR
jgi:hypothetical protein